MYKVLNEVTGYKEEKTLPYELDDERLASDFSNYFDLKINNILQKLNEHDGDEEYYENTIRQINDQNNEQVNSSLQSFAEISSEDIGKLMRSTKKTYNLSDPFPIGDVMNAENFDLIVQIFTRITNLSMSTQTFPDSEKNAIVHPLYKGEGDANDMKHYRPVSNLSFLSKIIL